MFRIITDPLFPSFSHHHCHEISYTTNFLGENVFLSLENTMWWAVRSFKPYACSAIWKFFLMKVTNLHVYIYFCQNMYTITLLRVFLILRPHYWLTNS